MNSFRSSILSGKGSAPASLLGEKRPRGVQQDSLGTIPVARTAIRTADHRDDDRHRLLEEQTEVRFRGQDLPVDLLNLSGGGAMIRANFSPLMWERVDLVLGHEGVAECAVRWIRGDRIGLEFAHETQVDADPRARDAMLLEVIRRSFPDLQASSAPAAAPEPPPIRTIADNKLSRRTQPRHPLIWSGAVLFNHDSTPVRLRNISSIGALVETAQPIPVDAEVYLDLGEAGSLFATVTWGVGDQIGLRFAQPFDIANLAKARPELAPQRWARPDYLREDKSESSPWADQWRRMSVEELKSSLDGYLKH